MLIGDCEGVPVGRAVILQTVGVLQIGHPVVILCNGVVLFPAEPARLPKRRERFQLRP